EPRTLSGLGDAGGPLREGLGDTSDFGLGNARTLIMDAEAQIARRINAPDHGDGGAVGRELDRVGEQIDPDLAHGARIAVEHGKVRLKISDDLHVLRLGADVEKMAALICDLHDVDIFLDNLEPARLDAGEIENVV